MTKIQNPKLARRARNAFRSFCMAVLRLFRISSFVLRISLPGLAFLLIFLLSPELGIRFANRFLEPIMDKQETPRLSRAAWEALRAFGATPRTEEAFYLEFQKLSPGHRSCLRQAWSLRTDWDLFIRICRFWGVGRRISRRDRREQAFWALDERQLRLPFAEQRRA